MIDLWTSRRDKFIECEYYSQNKNENFVSNNEIVYNKKPTGYFLAKEVGSYSKESNVVNNSFMIEKTTITIQTDDDVTNLKRNDIVIMEGKKYFVVDKQFDPKSNQKQFLKDSFVSRSTYIALRG